MSSAPHILAFHCMGILEYSLAESGSTCAEVLGAVKLCCFVFQEAAILHQLAMLTEFPEKHFSRSLLTVLVFVFVLLWVFLKTL